MTRVVAMLVGSSVLLAACGGGGGSEPPPNLSIGGTVSGLAGGSVVLRNNGTNDLTVTANGGFTFSNQIASGATYSVAVATNPASPAQTCTVASGSGTATAAVTSVAVTCTTNTYTLGGTVSGLAPGQSLVLTNGTTNLTVNANAAFTFASAVPSGSAYNVVVSTQPAGQTCSVQNGGGTIAAAAVTNVSVACSSNAYTVSGTIAGLLGSGLVLQNNSGNDQTPAAGATAFNFPSVAGSSPYAVAVASQPVNPSQTCSVANGSGTGTGGNVTNVAVTCATNSFAVNVNVTGLSGAGLVLRNNGGNNLAVNANGSVPFSTQVQSGSAYAVTVFAQPTSPTQTCIVGGNATGTVGNGPVTVNVTCSTFSGTIGGTVSGLSGTGLTLTNNAGNTLSISGNGAFTFTTPVASGATYAVAAATQPTAPAQTCAVGNGTGTVASANITNVTVTCTTTTFTVGGTVAGLPAGTNVVLRNNGGDDKTVSANGAFTFTTAVNDAAPYAVTVQTQPSWAPASSSSPPRNCDVISGGSGTLSGANVSTAKVVCHSRFAFVANRSGDARLTNYSVGATGALTQVDFETQQSSIAGVTEADAQAVATTPTATHAFVVVDAGLADPALLTTSGHIRTYQIDSAGQLTFATDTTVPNVATALNQVSDPLQILVDPDASVFDAVGRRRIYVVDGSNGAASGNEAIHEYSFDFPSATLTHQGAVSVPAITSALMDSEGKWLFASTYTAHEIVPILINATTGALTPAAATVVGTQASVMHMAIDPTGNLLFVAHQEDAKIYTYEINRTTGALTLKDTDSTFGGAELTTPVVALQVDPTGRPVVYAARANGDIQLYAISAASGGVYSIALSSTVTRTLVNPIHVLFKLAIDKDGLFLYHVDYHTTGDLGIFRINQTTGALDTPPTLFLPPDNGVSSANTGTLGIALP